MLLGFLWGVVACQLVRDDGVYCGTSGRGVNDPSIPEREKEYMRVYVCHFALCIA